MLSARRVVVALVLAAVAGTVTGLVAGTVDLVRDYEPPAAVFTPPAGG
jgi:ABC-type nitrate/sulfonate/bicarbonate transport system permease component